MPFNIFTYNGDVGSGALPSDTAVQAGAAGSQAASMVKASGNLWNQSPAGGLASGGTAADYVVAVATIPAIAFDAAGRTVDITANGSFAANANTKTVKLIVAPTTATLGSAVVGGTTVASTGAVTTNGAGWGLGASVTKTGAKGSNTQNAIHFSAQCGNVVSTLINPSALTLLESATITVAVTVNCATAATDALLWNFQGQWFN
jgi:hypothetical protein